MRRGRIIPLVDTWLVANARLGIWITYGEEWDDQDEEEDDEEGRKGTDIGSRPATGRGKGTDDASGVILIEYLGITRLEYLEG
jgi:hypothetical protein